MLSICIATDDADREQWLAAGLRLRDVMVAVVNPPSEVPSTEAVVFAGKRPIGLSNVEKLLNAGQHVFLAGTEYTPAKTCDSLAGLATARGATFSIANPDLHLPSRQLIKQQLVAGKLGRVGLIRSHRWEAVTDEDSHNRSEIPASFVRDLETAVWLTGSRPTTVFAVTQNRYNHVHLGFTSGMALLDYTNGLPPGDGYRALSVIGSTGAAYADDQQNAQLVFRGGPPQAVAAGEGLKARVSMLQEFVAMINGERGAAEALDLRRDTQAALDAVKQSLATHQAAVPEGR